MSPRGIILGAAAVLTVTAAAPDVLAFCRSTTCTGECARDLDNCKTEGNPLYWPGLCVSFSLQQNGSEYVDFAEFERVAEASVAEWSDLDCGDGAATISFTRKPDVECHKAEYNKDGANANIILFQDTRWDYQGVDNTLAKTTVTYDNETGEILDADIELNHAYNEFTTGDDYVAYDLQSILTHEFGHFIGLDHTEDLVATMNAGYQEGTIELRTLEDDDIAGACTVYPSSRNVTCRPEPNGGFSGACAEEAAAGDADSCSIAPHDPDGRPPAGWAGFAGMMVAGAASLRSLRRALRAFMVRR